MGSLTIHQNYFDIACRNHEKYRRVTQELAAIDQGIDAGEYTRAEKLAATEGLFAEQQEHLVVSITFYGLCLEAFIYYFGMQEIGSTFLDSEIDKLPLPAKFLLCVYLSSGKALPKSDHRYALVKKLSAHRNELVHFKAKPIDDSTNRGQVISALIAKLDQAIDVCEEAVASAINYIDEVNDTGGHYALSILRENAQTS